MITEFFIDKFFYLFEHLWLKLNIDLSFFAELVDVASSHLDTVINVIKAVQFVMPNGVKLLIPFVFLLIFLRLLICLLWFIVDLFKALKP